MPPLEPHPLGSVSGGEGTGASSLSWASGLGGHSHRVPEDKPGPALGPHTVDPDPTRLRPAACHLREGGEGEAPLLVSRPLSCGLGLDAGTP